MEAHLEKARDLNVIAYTKIHTVINGRAGHSVSCLNVGDHRQDFSPDLTDEGSTVKGKSEAAVKRTMKPCAHAATSSGARFGSVTAYCFCIMGQSDPPYCSKVSQSEAEKENQS